MASLLWRFLPLYSPYLIQCTCRISCVGTVARSPGTELGIGAVGALQCARSSDRGWVNWNELSPKPSSITALIEEVMWGSCVLVFIMWVVCPYGTHPQTSSCQIYYGPSIFIRRTGESLHVWVPLFGSRYRADANRPWLCSFHAVKP